MQIDIILAYNISLQEKLVMLYGQHVTLSVESISYSFLFP